MSVADEKEARDKRRSVKLSSFARRLFNEWRRLALPISDERIVIAASGGADSTALLLGFDEILKAKGLGLKITVAHLDHGLRGENGARDVGKVVRLLSDLNYEIETAEVKVKERAAASHDNLEQAARRARYEFLEQAARKFRSRFVLTGHTLDDQAETVLLRLIRGSAAEGLGGMEPVRFLDASKKISLVRPLLRWARRTDTEEYCRARGVEFCVDEMNANEQFARVRVRRKLLPLLETFNPRIVETLARTADLLREDASLLKAEAAVLSNKSSVSDDERGSSPLLIQPLKSAPPAIRRRALRLWIERERGSVRRLELVHLKNVESLLQGERGGRVIELPGGGCVERRKGKLYFRKSCEKIET
jgi:tRNA(Ile)-lysidine synthase